MKKKISKHIIFGNSNACIPTPLFSFSKKGSLGGLFSRTFTVVVNGEYCCDYLCDYQNAINMSITHINIGQVEVILAPSKFSRVDFFCCVNAEALTSIIIIWSQQKRIHMNQKIKHPQETMIQCGSTNSMPMFMGNANKKIIQYQ